EELQLARARPAARPGGELPPGRDERLLAAGIRLPAARGVDRVAHQRLPFPFGWGTIRMYGRGSCQSPESCLASSLETEPAMITSSPGCQFTGVETLWPAVSWSESSTRSTSSKLRPVVIG